MIFFIANKIRCAPVAKLHNQPTELRQAAKPFTREKHAEVVEDFGIISDADQPILQMGKEQKPMREFAQGW